MLQACLLLALVCNLASSQFVPWRRQRADERYIYTGIDGRVEIGWSDATSTGIKTSYNWDGQGAEGLAKVQFNEASGTWRLTTTAENAYAVKPNSELVLRIKADGDDVPLTLFAGYNEKNDAQQPLQYDFTASKGWRMYRVSTAPLSNNGIPKIRLAGIENKSGKPVSIYVGYLFLAVN